MDKAKEGQLEVAFKENNLTFNNRLEIIEDGIRKSYLTRLHDMDIAPLENLPELEDDIIDNIRLYHIEEMVYQKDEPIIEKLTTVFNTLSTYEASLFILMDSDGKKTDFYVGVRNNEADDNLKRSTVTLGDTLQSTLIGHFPGARIHSEDRKKIATISNKIMKKNNVASVSVLGSNRLEQGAGNEKFIQGMEKFMLAMNDKEYTGIILAKNQTPEAIQELRRQYQDLYTRLSPFQNEQVSLSSSESTSKNKSFSEMDGKQKAAMVGAALVSIAGIVGGAYFGAAAKGLEMVSGAMLGGQIAGQFGGFLNALAPTEQISKSTSTSSTTTTTNKQVADLLKMLDDTLTRLNEFDSYGMWNVAGYFISDDMSTAEIAASNYRSLMNGDNSGREVSAINSWKNNEENARAFKYLTTYMSRFLHPQFCYGQTEDRAILTDATTAISGKELALHLGLPRATVSGLPVIEHAEFGKEVVKYQIHHKTEHVRPEDRIALGKVFDLGQVTEKVVELENKSLTMHTFITGSTGSGKSNTVYQMLAELHQDKIPFLVVEPAKGEYKDVFGNWPDVNVYSTNPNVAPLININPFKFPESIHVLEHIDGLVEIFSVCWPMYDAMPAFFKEGILRSYEAVGWDLGSSTFEGDEPEYPDFETLADELERLIGESDYASDVKSNYRGALITRVRSLSVGLNKFVFSQAQTPYEKIFDENCILDISRVKSSETKALIMGLVVYILNEYRIDTKDASNSGCKHITVLEEAHNLLKNASGMESELVRKSVEMITNTIAEIRTYGEGFVIVDQSPSSVDIAAIKNTNTKIVLRTPEANDREAVGRSIGLTESQVNEIAKLPSGVAVVYQNNWANPVLTNIYKAKVTESPYKNPAPIKIKPLKEARTELIRMLMKPWLGGEKIHLKDLKNDLSSLDLNHNMRVRIRNYISDYGFLGGDMLWREEDIPILQKCLRAVLYISDDEFTRIAVSATADDLRKLVRDKTSNLSADEIEEVCSLLTKVEEDDAGN